jgi:hypothetical protein
VFRGPALSDERGGCYDISLLSARVDQVYSVDREIAPRRVTTLVTALAMNHAPNIPVLTCRLRGAMVLQLHPPAALRVVLPPR